MKSGITKFFQLTNIVSKTLFIKAALFASPLLLASCQKVIGHLPGNKIDADIIYLETNDFTNQNNALLAYVNTGDGNLVPLHGSPFYTNGEGVGNPDLLLRQRWRRLVMRPKK